MNKVDVANGNLVKSQFIWIEDGKQNASFEPKAEPGINFRFESCLVALRRLGLHHT